MLSSRASDQEDGHLDTGDGLVGAVQLQFGVVAGADAQLGQLVDAPLVHVPLVVGERARVGVAHPYPETALDPFGYLNPEAFDGQALAGAVHMVRQFNDRCAVILCGRDRLDAATQAGAAKPVRGVGFGVFPAGGGALVDTVDLDAFRGDTGVVPSRYPGTERDEVSGFPDR